MKFFTFLSIFSLMVLNSYASDHPLQKRATQVSINSFTFTNNVLAGSIRIQNIAFTKIVTVIYGVGNNWSDNQRIRAAWSNGPGADGYETWTFSGTATGATQFYIKYDVSGSSYYDPGNNANHQISVPSSSTTSPRCTVTVTTTIPLNLMPRMAEITGF